MTSTHTTARDQAINLLTRLLERFEPRSEWRHTDVEEIVDQLIDAARAPESAHTRALAEDQPRETRPPGRRGLPPPAAADDGDR